MRSPNHIPLSKRFWNSVGAIALLGWGGYGLYTNDLVIPLKRRSDLHLHHEPAFFMFAALLCGALVLASVVVDHYDRRNNEHKYKDFADRMSIWGWVLFIVAVVLHGGIKLHQMAV